MRQDPRPFRRKKSSIYYFYYYDESGKRTCRSTGKTRKWEAADYIKDFLNELSGEEESAATISGRLTFREYAEPFFIWDKCPRVKRRLNEGKSIGQTHVTKSRGWLEQYVFPDRFSTLKMSAIRRADILDLQERLREKTGTNTLNKVISTVKTVLSEAYFREDIDRNPGSRIGAIKYEKEEPGIFTQEEIKALFESDEFWTDRYDYTCFLLAATTGMRKGEILALRWKHVNWDESFLNIQEAWKNRTELGPPKWDSIRVVPLPEKGVEALKRIHDESLRCLPEDMVFCYDDGKRLGDTWWQKRFRKAMKKAEIDHDSRNLKPHSFRHTINTILRNAGENPAKIRAALGWQKETAQENYTHWQIEHLREQARIVDEILG